MDCGLWGPSRHELQPDVRPHSRTLTHSPLASSFLVPVSLTALGACFLLDGLPVSTTVPLCR